MRRFFTSESVTEGHPDKLCDLIADSILDAYLAVDPAARVACEVMAAKNLVLISGEITSTARVDLESTARRAILDAGYTCAEAGLDGRSCRILTTVTAQSADIASGVDREEDTGAGDQGMVFGYACDETPSLMPLPIELAHKMARLLAAVRKDGTLTYLRPDGKTQVTMEYDGEKPVRAEAIVLSAQHDPSVPRDQLEWELREKVIRPVMGPWIDAKTKILINPTGRFVLGGPAADTGLTGRKIIADTYGGAARHGGGAFSGKDPTKVDRSGSYMARYVAKNVVAAGLARRCEVQIAYAIGVAKPVSVWVETFGTGKMPDELLTRRVAERVDLRPAAILRTLGLRQPMYRATAAYGHFGREDFPWEKKDLAALLRKP